MTKYLVVNADDFGLSKGISDGILEALQKKWVSDVSMVANGEAFDYAVSLLKREDIASCGVHLCFIDKESPLTDAPGFLLDHGRFLTNRYKLLFRSLLKRREFLGFLERELRAQIKKVKDSGLQVSHLDGHQHLHIFPGISEIVIKLCVEYDVPFVRLPWADRFSPASSVMNFLSRRMKRLAALHAVDSPVTLGFDTSGHLSRADVTHYLERIDRSSESFFELITHPGFGDSETIRKYSHWGYSWDAEQEALSVLTTACLDSKNITLTNFSEAASHELPTLSASASRATV